MLANTPPPTDAGGGIDPVTSVILDAQVAELKHQVDTAVAAWHEAQRVCASAITALYGGPTYRPDNGDGRPDPGEFGHTAAQLGAAGQPLPWWGTPTDDDHGFLGDLANGFLVDGLWADVTGLGSLIGITPHGGHDWAHAGKAWGAIGNLTIIGYLDDMARGEMNPLQAIGTMYSAWGPVLGSLVAADEWARNPANALGQTIYNVGTLPLAILKAAKPITAATRVTSGALSNAGRHVLDALTRMPTIDEILRAHADRLDLHPRFGAMPAIVGDGPGGYQFDADSSPDSGGNPTDSPSVGGTDRPDPAAVGAARERRVAELTGGTVPSGAPGQPGLRIVRPGVGASDVDVIGADGSYIQVGGPMKAHKLQRTGSALSILRWAAERDGRRALAYFEEGTPESVLNLARRTLGPDNVFTFTP